MSTQVKIPQNKIMNIEDATKKVSFEKEENNAFNKQIEQMVTKDTNLLYFLKKIKHKYTMDNIYNIAYLQKCCVVLSNISNYVYHFK